MAAINFPSPSSCLQLALFQSCYCFLPRANKSPLQISKTSPLKISHASPQKHYLLPAYPLRNRNAALLWKKISNQSTPLHSLIACSFLESPLNRCRSLIASPIHYYGSLAANQESTCGPMRLWHLANTGCKKVSPKWGSTGIFFFSDSF